MGVWLVDFQECLLSGRGWRRKELKRNACKFNDIAGTSEAFQHSDTHRQINRNCSGGNMALPTPTILSGVS